MNNEIALTKAQTAKFVSNAADMEVSIFTLKKAVDELRRRKSEALRSPEKAEEDFNKAKAGFESAKAALDEAEASKFKYKPFDNGGCLLYYFKLSFLIPLELFPLYGILMGTGVWDKLMTNATSPIFIVFFVVVVALNIWLLHRSNLKKEKKHNEEHLRQNEKHISSCSQKYNEAKSEYQKATARRDRAQKSAQETARMIDCQISKLENESKRISKNLSEYYQNNVIKPKYRNIECVVIMEELFVNDRVDTMREAMDKCEERLFRNEVISIGHNIERSLGQMMVQLSEITYKLDSINRNVDMMSVDVFKMTEQIASGNKRQNENMEKLIEETKLSRYAAEKAQASLEYLSSN